MTQRALADAVGVGQQHIQRIETQPDIKVYREQQRKAKGTDFERDPEEGPYQSVTVIIWFADGTQRRTLL